MQTPQRITFDFIRQRRGGTFLAVCIGLVNSVVTLLLPLSLGRFYEAFFGSSNRSRLLEALGLRLGEGLTAFFWLFGALVLFKGLLEYAEKYQTGRLSEQFIKGLRERLFGQQLRAPIAVHRQKAVGKYLLRYANDLKSIRKFLTDGVLLFIRDVLFLLMTLAVLSYLNAELTFLMLATAVPFLLVFRWINGRLEAFSLERRNIRSSNLSYVTSRLSALETVKVFNREPIEEEQFRRRSGQVSAVNLSFRRWWSVREALLPVATFSLIGVMLAAIAVQNSHGLSRVNGGVLIAFLLMALNTRPVIRRLLRVGMIWTSARLSLNKLTDLLNQPTEEVPVEGDSEPKMGHIRVDNVSFGYEPGELLLQRVSFEAGPGRLTLLTGRLGSGKTTLLHLILKLYEPTQGRVLLNGRDMQTLPPQVVRRSVTLVSESAPLLGRTVFEAVSYSRKPEKRRRAETMLNQIQDIVGLVPALTLDQPIGETGDRLSAGQRQVLRLVRALLTNKPILLLDEPFAGLDRGGAQRLGQFFNTLAEKRTLILVTKTPIDGLQIGQTVSVDSETPMYQLN